MGDSIWEFLWCLDRITAEHDGVGLVLGGSPVKLETIIADLKGDKETVRRHLKKLVDGKYIRMRRTPYGQVIEVLHSKKFGIWQKEKPQIAVSLPERSDFFEREKLLKAVSKEDTAVERQQKAAAEPAAASHLTSNPEPENSVWSFLEIQPCGPPPFRTLLETGWANRNGEPHSILIRDAVNAWKAADGQNPKYCAPLFRALKKLREHERANPKPSAAESEEIHMLTTEEIPA